jgi:ATP citrate (pro-S)-lyase
MTCIVCLLVHALPEGVPERDTKQMVAYARKHNKVILGPATVGGIQVGGSGFA